MHSIISVDQFGFQRGKGTLDALEALTERVYSSLNSKEHSACIFVDLRKTFDTVNHAILLRKLECYGIRGLVYSVLLATCAIVRNVLK